MNSNINKTLIIFGCGFLGWILIVMLLLLYFGQDADEYAVAALSTIITIGGMMIAGGMWLR